MTSKQRGLMLVEVIVAATLLAVLLVVSLRVLSAMALQRRAIEKRAIAVQLAAGALERARGLPFEQITAERLAEIHLASTAAQILPGASLTWTLEPDDTAPAAKRIRAEVAWNTSVAGQNESVRLNYWAHAPSASSGGSP